MATITGTRRAAVRHRPAELDVHGLESIWNGPHETWAYCILNNLQTLGVAAEDGPWLGAGSVPLGSVVHAGRQRSGLLHAPGAARVGQPATGARGSNDGVRIRAPPGSGSSDLSGQFGLGHPVKLGKHVGGPRHLTGGKGRVELVQLPGVGAGG